jgi:hypothetical protein
MRSVKERGKNGCVRIDFRNEKVSQEAKDLDRVVEEKRGAYRNFSLSFPISLIPLFRKGQIHQRMRKSGDGGRFQNSNSNLNLTGILVRSWASWISRMEQRLPERGSPFIGTLELS